LRVDKTGARHEQKNRIGDEWRQKQRKLGQDRTDHSPKLIVAVIIRESG
jgi:hypothetical protein